MEKTEMDNTTYNPLVSIIVPVFNGVKYLEACIESVLSQSYPHIEHIFIDGGSTDGTVDMLSRYSTKYPDRVRFISEPDEGAWDAVNKGVRIGKGEIFGVLGADDTYEPGAIQAIVDFFRANPGAHLVFGDCNYINEKGEIIRRPRAKDFNLKEAINGTMFPTGPSTFYSREVFEKIGLFDALVSDVDFIIRVGKVFQIYRIDKVLSSYRIHKGSLTTGSWERRKKQFRDVRIISRRHGGSIFSVYSRIYYAYVIIDWLRPVFGPVYPFIGKALGKNIGKSKDDWEIRLKG
jgi:glycosyltransferase involved in cell wall biosynthesis